MKVGKTIKKIVALGIGSTMLGATVLGAMAADLAEYPSPFVANGVFDALIVVGDNAAASDVVGSVDIATSLQYSMGVASGATGTGGVAISGDAAQIRSSGDMLEIMEPLGNVTEVLDEADLNALADGQIVNEEGTFTYGQYIRFAKGAEQYVDHTTDDDDEEETPADYLFMAGGEDIYQYELTFDTAVETDLVSAKCDDLEMKKITMIGREYTITNTECTSVGSAKLTLMGGEMRDTIEEGETKTYTIKGKEYEVTATIVSDILQKAKFTVNGEVTDEMMDDDTYTLSDGTVFGILSILPNEAGDVTQDLVDLYLGAEKMTLYDTNIMSTADGSQTLEVNEEQVDDVSVTIKGTNGTTEMKISRITVDAEASDDLYIAAGKGVSSVLEQPEAMFTSNWDIVYQGLSDVAVNEIRLNPSGDDEYQLVFTNMDGDQIKLPWLYLNATNGSRLYLGKELGKPLVLTEVTAITTDDYFLVGAIDDGDDAYTHALQYKSADASEQVAVFKDLGTGDTIKASFILNGTDLIGSLVLSGKEFDFNYTSATLDDQSIYVDMGDSNIIGGATGANVVAKGQAAMNILTGIPVANAWNRASINVTVDNSNIDTTSANEWIGMTLEAAAGEIDYQSLASNSPGFSMEQIGDEDNYVDMTVYGTKITRKESSSGPDTIVLEVPEEQIEPLVYVTAGKVTSSRVAGGGEAVTIVQIEVGSAVLASEVADVQAQNLIVVGGPCADSVAAEILGNPEDCAAGFEDGKAMIKLIPQASGKVALLVAGYSAMDTRAACRVLANYKDYALTGTEVEVTYTSLESITVGEPTVTE